jgi:alpha-tubulin suppressor-like RCC1 family protein
MPANLADVALVAAGGRHSLALRRDGTIALWGDNSLGQTNQPSGPGQTHLNSQ